MSELALLGGEPVSAGPLSGPEWPPVSEACAEQLREIYLSRQWSFSKAPEIEFAEAFAAYHGAKRCVFMANGTVTMQCALAALGVGPGDEVIVPALTWLATAMAARYVGATPVFADIEPTTLCLDPDAFADAITPKTRAVVPVHLYGSMADLDRIVEIARRRDLAVVEDCAHMHGGKWSERGVGSWGDVGSFSFQQSKTLASGEGGACITSDDELAERIYRLKHIGYASNEYQGEAKARPPEGLVCHNFRATSFQAAILSDQLGSLGARIARYEDAAARFQRRLTDVDGVRIQQRGRKASPQGYYMLCFIFDELPTADIPLQALSAALAAEGLSVGRTYGPVYHHTLFNLRPDEYRIHNGVCPVAEGIATERTLCLSHSRLEADETVIEAMAECVAKVVANVEDLRDWEPEAAS